MLFTLRRAWRKLLFATRRHRLARELAEELELHSRLQQAAQLQQGRTAAAAAVESRRAMGNILLAKEESRDMWSFLSIEYLLQDICFALRVFRKNLGFSSIAILSLALGIAGNTAIFSIINALLIRPLPFREPSRLVRITQLYPKAILEYFRQHTRTMDIAFVARGSELNLTGQGPAVRITASETFANFFSVLSASVDRGRVFDADEDRPGKDGVVILSHELWRTAFQQDPNILGRTITLAAHQSPRGGHSADNFFFPIHESPSVDSDAHRSVQYGRLLGRRLRAAHRPAPSRGHHPASAG